jgi:SAM-dependent methyltransferase
MDRAPPSPPGPCACCGGAFRPTPWSVPLRREDPSRPGVLEFPEFPLWRCAGCGSLHADVDDASFASHLATASYTDPAQEAAFLQRRRAFFDWVASLCDDAPRASGPRRALDFGCSYGHLLQAFRGRGWDVAGVESTPRALDVARANLPGASLAGTLADAAGDRPLQAATAIDVLYCLSRPDVLLRDLAGRIVPGGRLVLRVTNRTWLVPALALAPRSRVRGWVLGSARWAFSRRGVDAMLRRNGFTDVRFEETERGKEAPDRTRALYYRASEGLARATAGRLAFQGGILAVARRA